MFSVAQNNVTSQQRIHIDDNNIALGLIENVSFAFKQIF